MKASFVRIAAAVGSIVFVVVVFGGMGSLVGAFIASLIIGMVQTFSVAMDHSIGSLLGSIGVRLAADSAFSTITIAINEKLKTRNGRSYFMERSQDKVDA